MKNLFLRIIIAAIGIPLLLIFAKGGAWMRILLIVILQVAILREWKELNAARGRNIPTLNIALALIGLNLIVMNPHTTALACGITAVFAILIREVFHRERKPLACLGEATLFLFYVGFPLSVWAVLEHPEAAARFLPSGALIALWISTWFCDSAAYFVGRKFGRHKLYPAASPNKTIEGFISGVVGATAAPLLLLVFKWVHIDWLDILILGGIVGIIGQIGDLLESLMKREVGIKDTSSWLPGHGGFLDRFDSLLLSTPFFYAYLLLRSI